MEQSRKGWEVLDAAKFIAPLVKWEWDESYDAMSVSSDNHTVIFENEFVRVLELWIEPGDIEDYHTHSMNSMLIIDSPADMRYYGADKKVKFERKFPKDASQKTTFTWKEPEGLHAIENIDTKVLHGVRIELKK